MQLNCQNSTCAKAATRIMAVPQSTIAAVYVAPYCDEHTEEVIGFGGLPASGPVLIDAAREIEGIHS